VSNVQPLASSFNFDPRFDGGKQGIADRPDDRFAIGTDSLFFIAREGTEMRRLCFLGLVLALTGCQNNSGSLGYRKSGRVDDPMLSIAEQESRGRLRYSYIEDDRLSPKTGVDRPDPTYGRSN
jgi:hypothetical protein